MDKFKRLTWEEVCADRNLQDLPYRIELNRYNQIVLVPTASRHSRYQTRISRLLDQLLEDGESIVELAMDTADNVKVPDVSWATRQTLQAHDAELDTCWSSAPEICVEVLSPTNTRDEIDAKRALYFERGAQEVWECGLNGETSYYSPSGWLERSALCPHFPAQVVL